MRYLPTKRKIRKLILFFSKNLILKTVHISLLKEIPSSSFTQLDKMQRKFTWKNRNSDDESSALGNDEIMFNLFKYPMHESNISSSFYQKVTSLEIYLPISTKYKIKIPRSKHFKILSRNFEEMGEILIWKFYQSYFLWASFRDVPKFHF